MNYLRKRMAWSACKANLIFPLSIIISLAIPFFNKFWSRGYHGELTGTFLVLVPLMYLVSAAFYYSVLDYYIDPCLNEERIKTYFENNRFNQTGVNYQNKFVKMKFSKLESLAGARHCCKQSYYLHIHNDLTDKSYYYLHIHNDLTDKSYKFTVSSLELLIIEEGLRNYKLSVDEIIDYYEMELK